MAGTKKTILYAVYVLLLGGVLMFVLFPEDAVRNHLVNRLNREMPSTRISIESLGLGLPSSLTLDEVTLSRDSSVLFFMDRLKLSPGWLSILSPRKKVHFRGDIYHGDISGILRIRPEGEGLDIWSSGDFSGIDLGILEIVRMQPGLELSGTLAGAFQIEASPQDVTTGTGNILISDCNLSLSRTFSDLQQLLNIDHLEFERIEADVDVDGTRLTIQNCELEGTQMRGRITGDILIGTPLTRSEMALEIAVTPLLSSTLSEINELTFSATGRFENPKVSNLVVR